MRRGRQITVGSELTGQLPDRVELFCLSGGKCHHLCKRWQQTMTTEHQPTRVQRQF